MGLVMFGDSQARSVEPSDSEGAWEAEADHVAISNILSSLPHGLGPGSPEDSGYVTPMEE